MVSASEAESRLAALTSEPELIAIDGLPLSGKSTFAERLADRFGWAVLGFDDFYLPERDCGFTQRRIDKRITGSLTGRPNLAHRRKFPADAG